MKALVWIMLLGGCGNAAAPEPKPEVVEKETTQRIIVSERVAKDAGLLVAQVEMATLPATVELTGEVAANPDRVAQVSVRVAGRLVEVRFQEGQRVAAGEILASVESSEVAHVRSELSSTSTRAEAAHKRVDRVAKLVDAGTASTQDLETARAEATVLDADVSAARQTLASIGGGGGATARLELRAPFAGVVLRRNGVVGQPVAADHVVAEIVDLDHAIFLARLFEHDLARVREGADAEVRLDAYPELAFSGKVLTVGRQVEPVARAVIARIAIDDKSSSLKIGLFGAAVVVIPDPAAMPLLPIVPSSAVSKIDDHPVVFVEVGVRSFEVRTVELGHAVAGSVEVVKGLKAGDRVATGGLFTLKSLALKSTFGEED